MTDKDEFSQVQQEITSLTFDIKKRQRGLKDPEARAKLVTQDEHDRLVELIRRRDELHAKIGAESAG